MTKAVRIENADTSDYVVIAKVYDKGYPAGSPDKLAQTVVLGYPTKMSELGITSSRYIVVSEGQKRNGTDRRKTVTLHPEVERRADPHADRRQ